MRVLREEPDFVAAIPAKVAPKPASLAPQQNGDGALKSSLYALLQLEKASEAAGGSRPDSRQSRPEIADEKAHGPNGGVVAEKAPKDADADGKRRGDEPAEDQDEHDEREGDRDDFGEREVVLDDLRHPIEDRFASAELDRERTPLGRPVVRGQLVDDRSSLCVAGRFGNPEQDEGSTTVL